MTKITGIRDHVCKFKDCCKSFSKTERYGGIYTSSALALTVHDRITLKHDYGNLLIDR